MSRMREETEELLDARIGDALDKCARGCVAVLPFLSPCERRRAERALRQRREMARAWFFGGYDEAERVCLFLLPDYMSDALEGDLQQLPQGELLEMLGEDAQESVSAVLIKGSGYRTLSHRDYLGSVLNLGLDRSVIGDIAVQNEHSAVIFCSRTVSEFLIGALERVANDCVRCTPYVPDESFTDGRQYAPVNDTVASERLDCVVAALTNQSREAAQRAVRSGLVEVDFEVEDRVDLFLEPPVWISVRGFGRYRLRAFDGATKKGRLRMRAERLV